MNIFERIQERIAPRKRMTLEDIIGINLTADGITVNQALEIPAFSASVDFIANTVAGLPIKLYTENAEKFTTDEAPTDYRLSLLNDEPGGLYNGYEMKRAAVRDMLLYGSGYIYIERRNGKIHSLRYVENTDVTVAVNSDPIYRFAEILVAGKRYWPWDFIVLNRAGSHAGKGGSVIDNCRTLLTAAANEGNERAALALDKFAYEVKKYIGAYAAAMGGVDAIVFTAGVGENDADMRMRIASGLEYMGVKICPHCNATRGKEEISAADSKVKVFVIPTNEELMIAMDTAELA